MSHGTDPRFAPGARVGLSGGRTEQALPRPGQIELRLNASRLISRVERGESLEVTSGGRLVARIVPVRPLSGLAQLLAAVRRPHQRKKAISSTSRRASQCPERHFRRRGSPKCAPMSGSVAYLDSSPCANLLP